MAAGPAAQPAGQLPGWPADGLAGWLASLASWASGAEGMINLDSRHQSFRELRYKTGAMPIQGGEEEADRVHVRQHLMLLFTLEEI